MEPRFSMKRKRNFLPKVGITLVFSLIFAFLFSFFETSTQKKTEEKETVSVVEETVWESAVQKTKFIYKCGHEKNESKKVEDRFVGKTKENIEKNFLDVDVVSFSPKEISFEKNVDEDCPNHFIIRLIDNKIYVFRTNDENTVYKKREVNVNDLSKEDIKNLTDGVRADSELELLEMMESFS